MKSIYKKIVILLSLLFVFTTLHYGVMAKDEEGTKTKSIIGDYLNPVFSVNLTDGSSIFESKEQREKREELNNSILNGEADKQYSLYDRFGADIKFIPYFGETRIVLNLADEFYTSFFKKDLDLSINAETVKLLLKGSDVVSNNNVYEGRPTVLSSKEISNGLTDPRVSAYGLNVNTGGEAAVGNFLLSISNFIVGLTGMLSSAKLFTVATNVWNMFFTAEITKTLFSAMTDLLIPIGSIFIVVNLVIIAMKYIRGRSGFKNVIFYTINWVASAAIMFTLVSNPASFMQTANNLLTRFDESLDYTLQSTTNEVIVSDNVENLRQATLWYNIVFEPWCQGMFGNKYEYLYTTFSGKETKYQMVQSNDDVDGDAFDGIRYNSAKSTGDISVPIGGGAVIKNWAALAYSTQSKYHIDAVEGQQKEIPDVWPKAKTTPLNDSIYVDSFRWLDAKLNISPQYYEPTKSNPNYANSFEYSQGFMKYGFRSLYLALLLFPILIMSIRKTIVITLGITAVVRLWYYSFMSFIKPDEYNILSNLKKTFSYVYWFFWYTLITFLAINIYNILISSNLLITETAWIIIGIYLIGLRPGNEKEYVKRTIAKIKQVVNIGKRKLINIVKAK